jgi:uncharacterized membrane protein YqgA involved in biofilm formation
MRGVIPGIGTALNTGTVLIGGTVGLLVGRLLPVRFLTTIMHGLGLFTLVIGISFSASTRNAVLVLVSTLVGALLGEALRLEEGLKGLGAWLERALAPWLEGLVGAKGTPVAAAFVTTSLLFCVGPLTFLGTFEDGANGNITLLAIKSGLDGFAALAYAAALGWGVLLTAGTVLLFQGALTAAAFTLHGQLSTGLARELTAVGGIMIVGLGFNLLELKRIRVASFLPALVVLPLLVALLQSFGLHPI